MKQILVLPLIILACFFNQTEAASVNSVNTSLRQNETEQKHLKILEKFLDSWIETKNKNARGVVVYKFDGFLNLPYELQQNLKRAFPHYRFTIAALSVFHKVWVKENYYFLTENKTGKILIFSSNPISVGRNDFGTFGSVIVSHHVKDERIALFIAKTFAEIFLFGIKGRIGRIKQSLTDISILLCHGDFGIRDLGRTLIIKYKPGSRFESPYLNSDQWQSNQCTP